MDLGYALGSAGTNRVFPSQDPWWSAEAVNLLLITDGYFSAGELTSLNVFHTSRLQFRLGLILSQALTLTFASSFETHGIWTAPGLGGGAPWLPARLRFRSPINGKSGLCPPTCSPHAWNAIVFRPNTMKSVLHHQ